MGDGVYVIEGMRDGSLKTAVNVKGLISFAAPEADPFAPNFRGDDLPGAPCRRFPERRVCGAAEAAIGPSDRRWEPIFMERGFTGVICGRQAGHFRDSDVFRPVDGIGTSRE